MRRVIYVIAILSIGTFTRVVAQNGFSLGLGAGPNFYWGSISEEEKVGFTGQLDARYNFNNIVSTTLSYSFNRLQAARYDSTGVNEKYFKTNANNIDIHIGIDLFQLLPISTFRSPLKVILDAGAGISFYNEGLYYGEAYPIKNGELNYNYMEGEHGWGNSAKIHLGGEISYAIDERFAVYGNLLGHYHFTSELDGYAHYANNPEKSTFNDAYYTTSIGVRYNLGYEVEKTNKESNNSSRLLNRIGTIFQNFRFERYTNRKTAKESLKENQRKEPKKHERFLNQKQNGGYLK